jgi:hypothetical protein
MLNGKRGALRSGRRQIDRAILLVSLMLCSVNLAGRAKGRKMTISPASPANRPAI